ncbi:hypothetical protein CU633_10205 [Bacillus sp. V3-13]|uniref:YhcU family protein n=1 Tax=Bacillus sp. V3-13 TaxID=2053728 RepID=UPI000C76D174|nr:YhcU family protein [Bacillus sp. V3-13]PLR77559.1 hypothetical protein CU633_10205 [Bacillus sp. V3-13]
MKVVFASTPGQEEKIRELISYFYSSVFPLYFSDEDIKDFERSKILHTTARHFEYFSTLKEACQVIVCLQTLISILELSVQEEKYQALFYKNATILNEFSLYFPLTYGQFFEARSMKNNVFSIYSKAANELLI